MAFLVLTVAKPWDRPAPTPSPSAALVHPSVSPTPVGTIPVQPSATPTPAPFPELVPFLLTRPPAPGTPWTTIRWRHLDPANPLAHFGGALRWAGGYASLGDDGQGGTQLWTSPDGVAWNPVGNQTATTFWPGMRVEGVARFGRQLLAVTSLPDQAASLSGSTPRPVVLTTWLSDDGAAWQLHGGPIFPNPTLLNGPVLVAGSADRAVIAWNDAPQAGGQATGHLAVTEDGASWRPVSASALPSGFDVMDLVAAPGSGFLVAGRTLADGSASASIVRSDATARAWTPIAQPSDPAVAMGERASVVWRLIAGPKGLLATGDNPGRAFWWRSADGRRWIAVSGFAPIGPSGCPGTSPGCGAYPDGVLAGDGDRMVAVGRAGDNGSIGTWTSTDGLRWDRLDTPGAIPRARPASIALLPGGIVLSDNTDVWYGQAASEP